MNGQPGRRCGALGQSDGSVRWRVWAPKASKVDLVLGKGERCRHYPMQREERGFFHHALHDVLEGQRYAYRLDGGPERPDPCSLWQPEGVHRHSAVLWPERLPWSHQGWKGIPREDLVFYELHVGTFTPEGTFQAAIPRLESLRQFGVTAIQLMPVAQFPGTRNWGYDGVHPYAPQNSYGGPLGLQQLVDACHAAGLAIFLDVVYNHLGPEGNYLNEFGPYFTDRYRTPWGSAFNYDRAGSDIVRDFVLDNVLMWLEEYHVDGLRLDAIHAICDSSARPLLQAIKDVANDVSARTARTVHIIAESDLNDPRILLQVERGGCGLDGQWSDDFHHAVHTHLTGERQGYYVDYGEVQDLPRVLEQPFLYAGKYSPHRDRKYGAPATGLSGAQFVVALQNHDQIGNRARGDRLTTLLSPSALRLAASLLMFSPYLPLLFMGEEYGEDRPFQFFCSFEDTQLIENVRNGRRREFATFGWRGEIPDPQAESTFNHCVLSWAWPEASRQAAMRKLYGDLLTARRSWPVLRDFTHRSACLLPDPERGPILQLIRGGMTTKSGTTTLLLFNLTGETQRLPIRIPPEQAVLFTSEATRYHGNRRSDESIRDLLPHECIAMGPKGWKRFL